MNKTISAEEFDRRFDDGEDVIEFVDEASAVRMNEPTRKVNLTMPAWLVDGLDQAARHFAVSRQAIINMWLAEKLQEEF